MLRNAIGAPPPSPPVHAAGSPPGHAPGSAAVPPDAALPVAAVVGASAAAAEASMTLPLFASARFTAVAIHQSRHEQVGG